MDKYDDAIEYLTEAPEMIEKAWGHPRQIYGGCLFGFASDNRRVLDTNDMKRGCLTSIKLGLFDSSWPEVTEAIKADTRIPNDMFGITIENLPVFAEWQRKIDRIIEEGLE